MDELTLRQQEILGFLQVFSRERGFWPSIREIRDHFGFNSTNAVVGHLRALENKGYITRIAGQARTYRITYENSEEAPAEAESLEVIDMPVYGNIAAGLVVMAAINLILWMLCTRLFGIGYKLKP